MDNHNKHVEQTLIAMKKKITLCCYPGDKLIERRSRKKKIVTWIDVWYEIKMFQVEQSKMDEERLE